ncbi:YtxH domain-containing protein [Wenzhouxiangella sp. AB-CW3]|uniref:YtxH domain-containing protein n=1 Tax=Wenzhouxiangella sp. AB-CW3 TaxID=2771012 RepID=UPI00168ADA46|nr:YtxH domain-containing protein [Wenzhouxiangella sp. AB-CW3]QOC21449.1 YtxH domain-containing protein [Wenzhouxiangella sp. AB-CW3]
MTTSKHWSVVLSLLFAGGLFLAGCSDPGPAEEAGQEVDDAIEEAEDAFDDLGDEAEDALDDLDDEIDDQVD